MIRIRQEVQTLDLINRAPVENGTALVRTEAVIVHPRNPMPEELAIPCQKFTRRHR
jgi:hypothetical protein